MKKYISIAVLLAVFLIGCSEKASINEPIVNSNPTSEPNWIALPQANGMQVNQAVSTSQKIVGKDGGSIILNNSYSGGSFGKVTLTSCLTFPKLAFPGKDKTFTVSHDDSYCVSTFGPSIVFDRSLTFNITYTGIDLNRIDPSNVKFAYLSADGSVQYAENDGIKIDLSTGTLCVVNAIIPHFSRYGFVN